MTRTGNEPLAGKATFPKKRAAKKALHRLVAEDGGATLPEIIIALLLTSLILGVLGSAVYQLFTTTRLGNDTLVALHDLEIAGFWLTRDAREAQSFTPGSGAVYGSFVTGSSTVQYSYDSENSALVRTVGGQSRIVARHILQQSDVQFSVSDSLVTVVLTSTSGATSRSTTLKMSMRMA